MNKSIVTLTPETFKITVESKELEFPKNQLVEIWWKLGMLIQLEYENGHDLLDANDITYLPFTIKHPFGDGKEKEINKI